MQQVILKEEMAKRKAPPLGICFMGLAWVGPAIIQYGTEAQKQRFIPDILDGKYQWCTGYSEPGSGSDLASLQCKCVREGDEYVVNGQKIWTSIAMWSKWIILLVRTDPNPASKHDGITCLLVPMDTKGITVRPIKNMSGGAMFAEVFFDNVRVPVENRLGEEGQGWQVTVSALAHERSSIAEVEGLTRKLGELKELARKSKQERAARARGRRHPPPHRALRGEDRGHALQRHARAHQAAQGRAARRRDLDQQAAARRARGAARRDRAGDAGQRRSPRARDRRRPLADASRSRGRKS